MAQLEITLFGRFGVRLDGEELDQLDASKAQELLCYLLLHRDRPHPREALADVLWGETAGDQAKKHLRQALWKLHTVLDTRQKLSDRRLLLIDPAWITLNPRADLWLDVASFEDAVSLAEGIPGQALNTETARVLRLAVDLYRGDLLADWYADWCVYERERLQNVQLILLTKLIAYCEAHREYEAGIAYGNRLLQIDRAHERTHRALMRLQYRSGDRTAALRQYRICREALEEELGVGPAGSTADLYEQVRSDHLELDTGEPLPVPAGGKPELAGMRGSLDQIAASLADFQEMIQHLREEMDELRNSGA